MTNALFGHLNKTRWAAVRMMFARQEAAAVKKPRRTPSFHATPEDAPPEDRDFVRRVFEKRRKRMERVDSMSPDMRALVHEYGLTVVDAFLAKGITNPRTIRHLVNTVLAGSINGAPTPQVHIFEDHRA